MTVAISLHNMKKFCNGIISLIIAMAMKIKNDATN